MGKNIIAMSLIQEQAYQHKPTNIRYSKTVEGKLRVIIDACLQDFGELNRNKKMYKLLDMKESVENTTGFIYEGLIHRSLVGEAGHPVLDTSNKTKAINRQMSIDHSNISHRINKLDFVSNLLNGEVEALLTDRGDDFHNLITQNLSPAFSYRGIGPVEKIAGGILVKGPLKSRTWDWVFNPSHLIAYKSDSSGILSESYDPSNGSYNHNDHDDYIMLCESQIIDYVKEKDGNLSNIVDQFGVAYDKIELCSEGTHIKIMDDTDTTIIQLDDYVNNSIKGYINELATSKRFT